MESGYIRLTYFRHLNDELELEYCIQLINHAIESDANPHHAHFWDLFGSELSSKTLYNVNTYLASFCSRNDCLPAWRWYGDNAAGFVIGFKFDIKDIAPPPLDLSPEAVRVTYNKDKFNSLIQEIIILADTKFDYIMRKLQSDKCKKDFYHKFGMHLMSVFLLLLPRIKRQEYQAEEEIRLFLHSIPPEVSPIPHESLDHFKNTMILPKFVTNYIKEKKAFKMPFDKKNICEIIVGPRCNFEEAKKEIINKLLLFGYENDNVIISQENLYYRG